MKIPLLSWLFVLPICTLFVSFGIFVVSGQCLRDQQDLLIELKNSLIFNSTLSTKLVRWNESADCCSWEGVTCSEGRVVGLNLDSELISGGLDNSGSLFRLQYLQNLSLASNKLKTFPDFLRNQTILAILDLSDNQIHGQIPNWIWNLTNLNFLNLSYNSLEGPLPNLPYALRVLDLHFNQLHGQFPTPQSYLMHLDLSWNNFSFVLPASIAYCSLVALNLNRNLLEGVVPKSLANCTYLEVLDIGNNQIHDAFPCYLKDISSLRILILRSNNFYGSIGCGGPNATWLMLQIVDLSSNNFSGKLSIISFANSKAMVVDNKIQSKFNYLQYETIQPIKSYDYGNGLKITYISQYLDAITVTSKGLYSELGKFWDNFTLIDLSCNNLDGQQYQKPR
uniref:Leucine-rich repeat-containing N-terminal plant-type domain-containing protein n=1 Tax=Fagus sylvatica TaxID=28930 RepID=A0A2N9I208_FAGSY